MLPRAARQSFVQNLTTELQRWVKFTAVPVKCFIDDIPIMQTY